VKVPSVSLELVISDAMPVQPSGTPGAIAWQLPTVWQALRSDVTRQQQMSASAAPLQCLTAIRERIAARESTIG